MISDFKFDISRYLFHIFLKLTEISMRNINFPINWLKVNCLRQRGSRPLIRLRGRGCKKVKLSLSPEGSCGDCGRAALHQRAELIRHNPSDGDHRVIRELACFG